jgi:hypothetical protein
MDQQTIECPNLVALVRRIEPYISEDTVNPLPAPHPKSSLATDAGPLQAKWIVTPIGASFSAGIEQVLIFRRLVIELQIVGTVSPYALLRSALENFAQMAWLLGGNTREERRIRVLQTWAYDMDERDKYDKEIGHVPVPPAKTGSDRRAEIFALGASLNLPESRLKGKVLLGHTIRTAADEAGYPGGEAVAAWRMASGFVHGRMWPNLRATEPTEAIPMPGGAMVRIVISDEKLDEIAKWCDRLLERSLSLYMRRARNHIGP